MLVAFFPSLASPGAWEPLFDGSDVSQWRGMTGDPFPTDCWQVEDGLLKTVPGWKQRDLITTGQFEDFELEWEWRLSAGGNAGMKILVEDGRMHPDFVRPRRRAVLPMAAGFLVLLYAVWRRRRWLALAAGLLSIGGALGVAFFTRIGTWQAVGPEYQMLDDARHPDGRNGPAFQTGGAAGGGVEPVAHRETGSAGGVLVERRVRAGLLARRPRAGAAGGREQVP